MTHIGEEGAFGLVRGFSGFFGDGKCQGAFGKAIVSRFKAMLGEALLRHLISQPNQKIEDGGDFLLFDDGHLG